jgi:hypothetical protein
MVRPIKNPKEILSRWRAKTVRKDSLWTNLISRDIGSDLATYIIHEQMNDPSYYIPSKASLVSKKEQKRYLRLGHIGYDGKNLEEERERAIFLTDTELHTISNIEKDEILEKDPVYAKLNEFEKYARKCMNAHGVIKYGDSRPKQSEEDFPRFKEKIKASALTQEEQEHIENWGVLFDFYWLNYDRMQARQMTIEEYMHLAETPVENLVIEAINQKKRILEEHHKNMLNLVYQFAAILCPSGSRFPHCPIKANDLTLKLADYRMLKKLERLK